MSCPFGKIHWEEWDDLDLTACVDIIHRLPPVGSGSAPEYWIKSWNKYWYGPAPVAVVDQGDQGEEGAVRLGFKHLVHLGPICISVYLNILVNYGNSRWIRAHTSCRSWPARPGRGRCSLSGLPASCTPFNQTYIQSVWDFFLPLRNGWHVSGLFVYFFAKLLHLNFSHLSIVFPNFLKLLKTLNLFLSLPVLLNILQLFLISFCCFVGPLLSFSGFIIHSFGKLFSDAQLGSSGCVNVTLSQLLACYVCGQWPRAASVRTYATPPASIVVSLRDEATSAQSDHLRQYGPTRRPRQASSCHNATKRCLLSCSHNESLRDVCWVTICVSTSLRDARGKHSHVIT